MTQAPLTSEPSYLTGRAFRDWANYWLTDSNRIPPLHHLGMAPGGGVLMVAPCDVDDIGAFVATVEATDVCYHCEGRALVDGPQWLGTWSVFSAHVSPRVAEEPHAE